MAGEAIVSKHRSNFVPEERKAFGRSLGVACDITLSEAQFARNNQNRREPEPGRTRRMTGVSRPLQPMSRWRRSVLSGVVPG